MTKFIKNDNKENKQTENNAGCISSLNKWLKRWFSNEMRIKKKMSFFCFLDETTAFTRIFQQNEHKLQSECVCKWSSKHRQ